MGAHKFAESKKAIKCKLVLRKKFKVDKRLEFELRGLLNYVVYTSLTRAPVAKFSSVRVINHVCGNYNECGLALVGRQDDFCKWGIKGIYIYIYMIQPKGFQVKRHEKKNFTT